MAYNDVNNGDILYEADWDSIHTHGHTGAALDGQQLDWDNCWSDAVHSHASAAEGGSTLSSPTIVTPTISSTGWTNANHAHAAANSGGQLNFTTAFDATTKTCYLSIHPCAFIPSYWSNTEGYIYYAATEAHITSLNDIWYAPVFLPHGSVVTACIVYGNDATETWSLIGNGTHATENINTADTTITNPTIDNQNYKYYIATSNFEGGEEIQGALITYTVTADTQG